MKTTNLNTYKRAGNAAKALVHALRKDGHNPTLRKVYTREYTDGPRTLHGYEVDLYDGELGKVPGAHNYGGETDLRFPVFYEGWGTQLNVYQDLTLNNGDHVTYHFGRNLNWHMTLADYTTVTFVMQ
jgi:hypothetical protein|tara:strand:- start:1277 stop:1657 length:381 start_codon:yes stop_codon:yes gene_type:complete